MNTIEQEWNGYFGKCYGDKPVNERQRIECRQAFYSGAAIIMGKLGEIQERNLSEDDGVKVLETLYEEIAVELQRRSEEMEKRN